MNKDEKIRNKNKARKSNQEIPKQVAVWDNINMEKEKIITE